MNKSTNEPTPEYNPTLATTPMPTTPTLVRRGRKPGSKNATPDTPRAPRKPKDPRILALEVEFASKKKAVKAEDASARQLRVIREKRLPKLTPAHRHELYLELCKTETPEFPYMKGAETTAPTAAPPPLETQHQPMMQNEGQA